jgi:iturin family lipopeptide synthetase A
LFDRPIHLLTLSAKTDKALQDLVLSYQEHLKNFEKLAIADICLSANTGRTNFNHRLAIVASERQDLADKLAQISAKVETSNVFFSTLPSNHKSPKIAFLFTGQGSQYVNMGCQLYETQSTFRQAINECAELMEPDLKQPLLSVLYPEDRDRHLIDQTIYAQPTLFALEYALFRLWQSWGIVPNALLGHSVGEYVAAVVAGVMNLADGIKLVTARAKLMESLPSTGEMVAVFTTPDEIQKVVTIDGQSLSFAAYNNLKNNVISGDNHAIAAACDALTNAGIGFKKLRTSHAFHSVLMEPILAQFRQVTAAISYHSPQIPLISNRTGQQIGVNEIDAEYWCQHLRQTVKFADGLHTLDKLGIDIFLEIGPKTTLISIGQQCLTASSQMWLNSLRPSREDWMEMLNSLARLAVKGTEIDWAGFDRDYARQRIPLPTYPFQRKSYWIDAPTETIPLASMRSNENSTFSSQNLSPATVVDMTNQQRQHDILAQLHTSVAKLLKADPAEVDVNAPFLEMGADSLVLVEAIGYVERTFGIKIGIRQIFEELTTIALLAKYIHEQIPLEITSPEPVLATSANGKSATNGNSLRYTESNKLSYTPDIIQSTEDLTTNAASGLERIMQQQLQVVSNTMSDIVAQQLAVLREQTGNFKPAPNAIKETGAKHQPVVSTVNEDRESPPSPPKVSDRSRLKSTEQLSSSVELDRFINSYTQQTPNSKNVTQNNRTVLADSRASAGFRPSLKELVYPIIGDRAAGAYFWDIDNNKYIDISMGFGVLLFGHNPQFVKDAISAQMERGLQIGPQAQLAGEVARSIVELTGTERVAFCNSGTEAVMTAIRLARHTTGRHKIVIFTNSYHGHFDGILATASQGQSIPSTTGIAPLTVSDVLVLEYGEDSALEILRANATDIAAVIVEPVQSRNLSLQPREFLQQLRQATVDSGIALVFDEVLLGFRIHQGGAQAWFNIEADLVTYGKIIGGGLPIGVVAGRAEYLDGIDGGSWSYGNASYPSTEKTFFAGTFNKNHLGMAAAHAVLQHLKAVGPSLQTELNQRTLRLVSTLNDFFISEEVPIKVINFGSLFRFTFSGNFDQFFYHLIAKGIYIWEGRACFLSTAHTDEDINQIVQAIEATIREMRADGFWPQSSSDSATLPSSQKQATTVSSTAIAKVEQADSSPSSKVWNRQKPLGSRVNRKSVDPTRINNFSPANRNKKLDFSLYYFGEYEAQFSQGKYDLLFAGAKFADRHGFTAIWIPERHFHSFGGFSPNPSVIGAGLARETDKIQIRAGSVVLPLHHPIRVAEEWSVVDNLSQGRVGIAFASGWHPNDFVFAPESYGNHRELMFQGIETVQKLWRGESISMRSGAGNQIDVQTFPLPMQSQLPTWITVVNNPETYIKAGEIGAGVLTNLMNQTVEDLAENIAIYRESLFKNGYDPSSGQVTVLLHTLLGNDIDTVRQQARQPFCNYLRSSLGLFQSLVKSQELQVDIDSLSEDDKNFILSTAFDRYVQNSALIGTPDSCTPIINNLLAIGVDEIACFIDFGVDIDIALEGLPYVNELKERYQNFAPDIGGKSLQTSDETVSLPLTKAQQQLWFLVQLGDNSSAAYNESVILQLRGELKLTAMQQALQKVVDRHEALRTRIDPAGEVQHIFPSVKIDVPVIDFSKVNDDKRESQVTAWLLEDRQTPFDFTKNSLFRCQILKLEAQQHLLVVSAHHIITDGWSMGIMLQEIGAIYSVECQDGNLQLQSPLQFREYAQWLEQQAETAAMVSHKSYWLEQLYAPTPLLELPTDRPRRATKTFRANRQTIQLEPNLSNDLRRVSREQGCTLFITMLSAYKTLLHRLTGQSDILIGIPTAGRSLGGSQELIGYCTHLLPIRSQFVDNPSFLEYLRTLRGVLLDAYEHQDYPFANLLDLLSEQRKTNHVPLIPLITATFNLESSLATPEMPGLDTSLYAGPIGFADHDLSLNVTKVNTELVLSCDYSTELFDTETIGRMLGHFQTLLTEIVANPDRQISTLPILTNTERHQVLFDWNDTAREYPQDKCIHQLFEEQVAKTPDAIAVVFEQEELTYQQLNQRANQLAHHLQTLGVKPEVLVGICVERSLEMVVGLLGILKAGGAYVPLDPSYPAERLSYLLSDAGIEVLLTQNNLLSTLPSHSAQVVCLDTDRQVIESHSRENLVTGVSANNLAYVIYTSGSTGTPKGVQICQSSVVNFLFSMRCFPGVSQEDTFNAVTTISFDIAALEIYLPLSVGAKILIVSSEVAADADRLLSELSESRITVMQATPATWQMLLASGWSSHYSLKVLCGGEALSAQLAHQILETGSELWNLYGPTEATIWSLIVHLRVATTENKPSTIGRPIANTQVYILDPQMQPVPIGVAGELHIGGDGLARGYLNRPELTQAKFVPNPFSPQKSARLYKTGDLARYLPDGNIEFLGRIDHQVKIRGFRIELGEIEAVLSSHPQIQQVVAIATTDPAGHNRLIAYVVVSEEEHLSTQQLREFLQQQLPAYMVPSTFVILDTLPLTPNGKVDRKALPAPNPSQFSEVNFVPPRNALEQNLVKIWEEVLEIFPIGVRDNFFEIGGHSLIAASLMARIHEKFGKSLSLATLFQGPTIEQLAIVLLQQQDVQSWSPLIAIQPSGKRLPLFCVPGGAMDVIVLGSLAHHMVAQPFYGLQPKGLDGELEPHNRVEEMATCYIEALQVIQPQGPYLLAGHSFGSFIIFEMAQQLQEQGHEVALLAMMDEIAPLPIFKSVDINWRQEANGLNKEAKDLTLFVSLMERFFGNNAKLSYEVLRTLDSDAQLDYVASKLERANLLPPEFGSKHLRGFLNVCKGLSKAFEHFSPEKIYPGKITFFKSSEVHNDDFAAPELAEIRKDPALGWAQFCTETIEVHMVPGDHVSMLTEPHVQILAERLQSCIDKALAHHNVSGSPANMGKMG